jgi:hypothetical protein
LIHENHPYEGTSGPIFGTNGEIVKIEKYEPTDYGYLFVPKGFNTQEPKRGGAWQPE